MTENQGWIKLHRKSLESSVFKNPKIWTVWCWCLMKANHQPTKIPFNGKDLIVGRGSFITGREKGASECHISEQEWRTAINYLKSTNRITIKSTNKYTIITIYNWDLYQQDNQQTNQPVTNKQPTTNQQITTYKNDNNDKNDKNEKNNIIYKSKEIKVNKNNNINKIIPLFKEVNPFYEKFFKNKTERKSLENVIKKYGEEWTINLIKKLPEINAMPYSPKITSPYELETKLAKLKFFLEQEKNKIQKGGVMNL